MNKLYKYFAFAFCGALGMSMASCTDDYLPPTPPVSETFIDPDMPKDMLDGYTVAFNFSLGPMGCNAISLTRGDNSSTTNPYLREIENFVDLERLRILFFVCIPDYDGLPQEPDIVVNSETREPDYSPNGANNYSWERYHTRDYFLFESKSRWVVSLQDDSSTDAQYQVIAPVFTYGNNDEYDWDAIRYALTHYNFKIAILANRPEHVDFGNFDGLFGKGPEAKVEFRTYRGPNWGPEDTYIVSDYRSQKGKRDKYIQDEDFWKQKHTINDLHHCQWDAVYASKNNWSQVYDFIMGNPADSGIEEKIKEKGPFLEKPNDTLGENNGIEQTNLMGALSYWTHKVIGPDGNYVTDKDGKDANFYFLPSKENPIPMYGVQKFVKVNESQWPSGTPFNVSIQEDYNRRNIHLLRSLVKLELKIPKRVTSGNQTLNVDLGENTPILRYSNVMARCEPLDVETPTEVLWSKDENECEWNYIFNYGPTINQAYTNGTGKGVAVNNFQKRYAWFYGAWKHWWDYNVGTDFEGLKNPDYLKLPDPAKTGGRMGYPHIFNPVTQRNLNADIGECLIEDAAYYYYVVYTGERHINDPTGLKEDFTLPRTEVCYFSFEAKVGNGQKTTYNIELTDYDDSANSVLKKYKTGGTDVSGYRTEMVEALTKEETAGKGYWNWPLLRNHTYTFTVTGFGNSSDNAGLDVHVVSSEQRTVPDIFYY